MALNIGLNASVDNMRKWKAILERVEVNRTKAYKTDDETPRSVLNGFYLFRLQCA
jgi:hypothetical protein